ncbi:MAG: M1 family metallopeptidase [Bacteroidales bacterium]|nr:M1 family metallopeptidase [Bacteroidales bacterium]
MSIKASSCIHNNRSLRVILVFLSVILTSGLSLAQTGKVSFHSDPGSVYENKVIRLNHLEAHITPDTLTETVKGTAIFDFSPLRPDIDSIVMYAPGIKPEYIKLNDINAGFAVSGSNLIIKGFADLFSEKHNRLEIKYQSTGPHEPYFVGWKDPTGRMRRQIWAHRPSGWIPFQNDRITVDLYITFSNKYQVYSNGTRVMIQDNPDMTRTWHYRMNKPHPFFSTALVIGKYNFKEMTTTSGVPLEYWYYPDQEDHFEPTYRYSTEMFEFLEKELGVPYPWELYRQAPVADYLYGAMETTTATIFGDYMQIDERGWWGRNYVNVNVHELTHQWFGNYIAHEPASDVWLTESMATYYAKLFEKSIYGDDFYEKEKLSEQQKAFSQSEKDDFPLAHSRAGSFRWYQKGSLVLDMLRDEMGDSLFRKAMTHYLLKFAFKEASSHDFIKAFYEVSGMPLNWFFDQWLFHGGEPHFEVSFSDNSSLKNPSTALSVRQIQPLSETSGLFRATAGITVGYKNGSTSNHKITITGKDSIFRLPNDDKIAVEYVIFDTGNRLLKKLTFNRSADVLAAAAIKAPLSIDRYEALTAMRNIPVEIKRATLLKCAGLSENELIYTEVLSQLQADTSKIVRTFFHGALRHPDALIRRSAVTSYIPLVDSDTSRLVYLLSDPDYINVELALRKLCNFMPAKANFWLYKTSGETGWRGNNIRIAWLEIAIRQGDRSKLDELKDYASVSFGFETRTNAIKALQTLGFIDKMHAINLVKAARYWNPKLSQPAREALNKYYADKDSRPFIEEALSKEQTNLKEVGIIAGSK